MGREKVLLENLSEVLDVFVKTSPGAIDFVGSVNKCADETKFVGIWSETEIIGKEASAGFLTINTSDRGMRTVVVDIRTSKKGIL